MAPEILEGKEYTNKCDLWSLGIIIYQLFFKNTPYNGINEFEVLKEIKKTKKNNVNRFNNTYLDDLVRKMLIEDPEKRITWKEYFDHPFFQNNILYFNN